MEENVTQPPVVPKNEPTDVYGIISIVLFMFFAPAGLVIGLIGAHIAQEQGNNPVLSRIGWIINLAQMLFILAGIIVLIVFVGVHKKEFRFKT